ncbi:MAG: hypothetical protein ACLPV4_22385, partial [Solirubrobacteraceae bacterium]
MPEYAARVRLARSGLPLLGPTVNFQPALGRRCSGRRRRCVSISSPGCSPRSGLLVFRSEFREPRLVPGWFLRFV